MKKILCLFLISLVVHTVWAQSGVGYDPENPGDPDVYYRLTLEAAPRSGGEVSTYNSKMVAAGTEVYCYASAKTGYTFSRWMKGDVVVSTESSFTYTMPEENVTLTAYFDFTGYNPDSPDDPFADGYQHKVTLYATPSAGGYFNSSNFMLAEGKTANVYAYPHSGYRFESWMIGNVVVSKDNPMMIKMNNTDLSYTAVFSYNPMNPNDPAANYFDQTNGSLVVDRFEPGHLNDAIHSKLGTWDNYNSVKSITVIGRMQSYDFGFSHGFDNCEMIDISRTTGYTEIPDYSFEELLSLNKIYFPMNVEKIGTKVFSGCKKLSDIYLYAVAPPQLSDEAFWGLDKNVKIHVPSSAVSLYTSSIGWKDFTIVSLDQNEKSITVNLPNEDGKYKNLTIELQNIHNGQLYKCLVTNRSSYIFYGLMKNTSYDVFLKTSTGIAIGKIKNVVLDDDDLSISFNSIEKLSDISLAVRTEEGQDVTKDVEITWLDDNGTYLCQGNRLTERLSGSNVRFRIKLNSELSVKYVQPSDSLYRVNDEANAVVCTLTPIEQIIIKGSVRDAFTKKGIYNATVSISQVLNNKYTKTIIAKTDKDGIYTAKVFKASATLTITANDYITKTTEVNNIGQTESVANVEDVLLTSLIGTIINVSFSYLPSVIDGDKSEMQDGYSDYQNVTYNIFNVTTQKEISQVSLRYPQLMIISGINIGDSIVLTAISKKDEFIPVVKGMTVDSTNILDIIIPIKEYGRINSKYLYSPNDTVVGILYNDFGCRINTFDYDETGNLSVTKLKDGNYTLVTMGKDINFNFIYLLDELRYMGLFERTDYCRNSFSIKSGEITEIKNDTVPKLDTEWLKYIRYKDFYVNKRSVTAGNYLTFTGGVLFSNMSSVSDVSLVMDLPETGKFVDNSVVVGSVISEYILDGNKLIIPLDKDQIGRSIKFCLIPLAKGSFAPNAFVKFKVNNEEKFVSIGVAEYNVESFNVAVPKTVTKKSIRLSGKAVARSLVEIYDNDVIIGQTMVAEDGTWSVTCELSNAYNLSSHSIYAKLKLGEKELLSETKVCYYNEDANVVKTITMSYYNGYYNKNFDVLFDLEHGITSPQSYYFYQPSDFSFIVDFANNDTTVVSDVNVYAVDGNNNKTKMPATYDENIGKWVAKHYFNSYDAPVNVSVSYQYNPVLRGDAEKLESDVDDVEISYNIWKNSLDSLFKNLGDYNVEIKNAEVFDELEELLAKDEYDNERISYLLSILADSISDDTPIDDNFVFDEETFNKEREEVSKRLQYLLTSGVDSLLSSYSINKDMFEGDFIENNFSYKLDNNGYEYTINDISAVDEYELIAKGYQKCELTDSSFIWFRLTAESMDFVDLNRRKEISMKLNDLNKVIMRAASGDSDTSSDKNIPVNHLITARNLINQLRENTDIQDVTNTLMTVSGLINTFYVTAYNAITKVDELDELTALLNAETERKNQYWEYLSKQKTISCSQFEHFKELERSVAKIQKSKDALNAFVNGPVMRFFSRMPRKLTKDQPKRLMNSSGNLLGGLGILIDLYNIYSDINGAIDNLESWNVLKNSIERKFPCEGDEDKAAALRERINKDSKELQTNYLRIIGSRVSALVCDALSLKSWKNIQVTLSLYTASIYLNLYSDLSTSLSVDGKYLNRKSRHWTDMRLLKCNKEKEEEPEPESDPAEKIMDPSGYVYESVSSNRLQGVTATAYYLEKTEDMYGVLHEKAVKWDAEEYAQENPLFTDENGRYAWDVPQGMWQVKFEKEGYETTYSEWLPVPPPQLDVNVAMTQVRQPEVKSVHAYKDGVEIEFDKYMIPETLTPDNIYVMADGMGVEGKTVLLNEEVSYEGKDTKFASKVRFNPNQPFTAKEIALTVVNKVKSYAGIQMADNYMQTFDIEEEIKGVVADSVIMVPYEKFKTVTISVYPASSAVGKIMRAKLSSDMMLSLDKEEVEIDEMGTAQFVIRGELPGMSAVTYSIDGFDISATQIVKIEVVDAGYREIPVPKSSITSGSSVYRGTKVELSTSEPKAKIYYTLDGSCPCDNVSRVLYKEPITVSSDVIIKSITVADDDTESDVATFTYSILQSNDGVGLNEGWNWVSLNMASESLANTNTALASGTWTSDDEIKNDRYTDSYSEKQKKWMGTLTMHGGRLDNAGMYKIHSSKAQTLALSGEAVNPGETSIAVNAGWNYISYLPLVEMNLTDALVGYDAQDGDVIKSQESFAVYSSTKGWEGSLDNMRPGMGYMLKRNASAGKTEFKYPVVTPMQQHVASASRSDICYKYADNMNIIGHVSGINVMQRDSIVALVGGEIRGMCRIGNDGSVWITIHGSDRKPVTLVLQRDGEFFATSGSMFGYESNKLYGLPDSPTNIDFTVNNVGESFGKIRTIYRLDGTAVPTRNIDRLSAGVYLIYSDMNGKPNVTKFIKR